MSWQVILGIGAVATLGFGWLLWQASGAPR
jgi:hypothetical protein